MDLSSRLRQIQAPVLGIYGVNDWVVHPNQAQLIQREVPNQLVEVFDRSGHFPMLDEPERFHMALLRFLEG
jgi:pimeloyl-ACP methyl ester carboxylesterase